MSGMSSSTFPNTNNHAASINAGTTATTSSSSCSGPRRSVFRHVTGFFLASEFFERLAYYGFAGSLVLFFQRTFNMSNEEADIHYSVWSGVCYLSPLVGGYVADCFCGRYRTILVSISQFHSIRIYSDPTTAVSARYSRFFTSSVPILLLAAPLVGHRHS
jgi:hypothetical protein